MPTRPRYPPARPARHYRRGGDDLRSRGYDVLSLFRTDEEGRLSVNEAFPQRQEAARAARRVV